MEGKTSRKLHLIVYHRALFKAHWALFIPSVGDPNLGRSIHAVGDARTGFQVTFGRNYDVATTGRSHSLIFLGYVDAAYIDDASTSGDGSHTTDHVPKDRIEDYAASVPAPGPSLRPSSSSSGNKRVEIRDCQTWLKDFITVLVEAGVLHQDSLDVINTAPEH
ncbi:hypothetical protein SPI_08245 [Niveomyces insectorum RCEF 264]|uniref:Uncharacterized protein n=1 Tax=Niveomyces insectorum RCEF 264 TaxID=1081102 RepID=A0A167NHG9_9HYPO|nr:hypothetical protein SPI_08245 [Niveomyces insectorum RCEF 264]